MNLNEKDSKYRKETKHFCKFCKIFIQNNFLQISKHEKEASHLRRMSKLLNNVVRSGSVGSGGGVGGGGSSKSSSSSNKPKPTSINPLLYGIGQDSNNPSSHEEWKKSEFKTTKEFELANSKVVLSANLPSAWEEVVEEEDIPNDGNHEPLHDTLLNTELVKVKDDSDESDGEKFKVTEKILPKSTIGQDKMSEDKSLAFKKRKNIKSSKISKK